MGYRNFTDRDGKTWEVRDRSPWDWDFHPIGDNPEQVRTVPAPTYERDPFELSQEELQRLLDAKGPSRSRRPQSPFKD